MSIYRIIGITGGAGYKVQVAETSSALRVIGIFVTEADATDWIANDQECHLYTGPQYVGHLAAAVPDAS